MNVEQLWNEIGIEKQIIYENFAGKTKLYMKCLNLFIKNDFIFVIENAIISNNYAIIETATHSLKGASANLGFKDLYELSSKIVSTARKKNYNDIPVLFKYLKIEYKRIEDIINKLLN